MCTSILITTISYLQVLSLNLHGQQNRILIHQLADKQIVRENFNKDGILLDKQVFLISQLRQVGIFYKIEVVTTLFNEADQFKKNYSTTYTCNTEESDMLIHVFPFSDSSDKRIKVIAKSTEFRDLYDLQNASLKDLRLKMQVKSSVLSFFGSKSLLIIKGRVKEIGESEVTVSSNFIIEKFLLGIRFKRVNYSINEFFTTDLVLKRQEFIEDNGAYFTMRHYSTKL
jgi:hypothetical protein